MICEFASVFSCNVPNVSAPLSTDVLKRGPQTVQQVLEALERFTSSIETELSEEAAISKPICTSVVVRC